MQTPTIIRPLTDAEMQRVFDTIDAADTPAQALVDGLFATFDALLADVGLNVREHFTPEEPLDPKNLKIPQAQWVEIGEALKASTDNSLSGTNALLDWMNLGPSSYAEDSR